ncbi:MAG: hypothetical protein HY924_09785 [Elusimicrobia bacterium]|nr:hypothetical protein [Elusimicrobiota bacterium]
MTDGTPACARADGLKGRVSIVVRSDEDILSAGRLSRDLCWCVGLGHREAFRASMGVTELASYLLRASQGEGRLVLQASMGEGGREFSVQAELPAAHGTGQAGQHGWPDLQGYLDSCRISQSEGGKSVLLAGCSRPAVGKAASAASSLDAGLTLHR